MAQKIDIAIDKNADGLFDISFADDGDLTTTEGFDTAIKLSIFCERRADSSEIPTARLRRGWIGNILSDVPDFEIGSKRWLYDQARMDDDTVNGITDAVQDGMTWFIEDGYLDNITTSSTFNGVVVTTVVELFRDSSRVDKQYFDVWRATGL